MSTNTSARAARYIAALALFSFVALAMAQPAGPAASQQVTLTLDRDLVTFVKVAVWAGGIFLAVFAVLAVGFFGFDVRTARKSLLEASDDIRTRTEAIRKDHQSLIELKERLEKLGAELVEQIEKKTPAEAAASESLPVQHEEVMPDEPSKIGPRSKAWKLNEAKRINLRKVIATAEFEWSTLGTLAKKTGLTESEIIELTADDPFVQRGFGRQGHVLFRLRHFNDPNNVGIGDAVRAMGPGIVTSVWEHAQRGKEPIRKGDFP